MEGAAWSEMHKMDGLTLAHLAFRDDDLLRREEDRLHRPDEHLDEVGIVAHLEDVHLVDHIPVPATHAALQPSTASTPRVYAYTSAKSHSGTPDEPPLHRMNS